MDEIVKMTVLTDDREETFQQPGIDLPGLAEGLPEHLPYLFFFMKQKPAKYAKAILQLPDVSLFVRIAGVEIAYALLLLEITVFRRSPLESVIQPPVWPGLFQT